ncbi:aminoglycoside phosphotransferase family protein [Synechococcus sp. MU1617]|uniref:aminoglycoside phosphotransferase family protein n=1 Tax=Synechococcus sp. MU1617 TaxID=2508346 RepID=UPI001CF85A34|nr:aminoglycoside phosphotransferase family protein [Synechococcus sp. MU1617]MCB4389377.1 hypothetical protein [Synechococcus sp. MU1617]
MSQLPDPWLTVLILAGGSLNNKQIGPLPSLSNNPADLADGSGLARDQINQHFRKLDGVKQCLLSDQSNTPIRPHLCDSGLEKLLIEPQSDVIASIKKALPKIETPWLLLQPITSLPTLDVELCYSIELGERPIPRENWSAVEAPETNKPRFLSRDQSVSTDEKPSHPFTGVICAPTELIEQLLPAAGSDLLLLAERLWKTGKVRFRMAPWMDLGHRATYSYSRLNRLKSRSFNKVSYDPRADLIRKCSSDQERLVQEYNYLRNLPLPLQRFFPALASQNMSTSNQEPSCLELEYIPFPNLAELFLHWQLGSNGWRQIARRLATARKIMLDSDAPEPTPQPVSTKWLYSQKLAKRLSLLRKQPPDLTSNLGLKWEKFWESPLHLQLVNPQGRETTKVMKLTSPHAASQAALKALPPLEKPQQLRRTHGDLCFNNILADPYSGSIRMIDPRGEAAPHSQWPSGYGDPRYDLVKLLHSCRYLYDIVCNSMFHLKLNDNVLTLQIDVPQHYDIVNNAIQEEVIKDELNPYEERFLTASLFLSMLPLHRQEPLHCVMFSCIAVLILENRFDNVLKASLSI